MRLRPLHLILVAAFVAVSGYVHGKWSNRWSGGTSTGGHNLLEAIEAGVGDWQAGDFLPINPADVPPNTRNHLRRFLPLKAGRPVTVSVTSGGPGAVAVHTPDVCYLGAGYKLRGGVTRQTIELPGGATAAFWVGDFDKTTAAGTDTFRVRWAWTADGNWQAPDLPRWVFARAPVLYKLYIVHPLTDEDDLTRDDPYRKFVADLLPALSRPLRN